MNEKRNQLVESARIARADVKPLSQLRAQDFAGLIIPGGFGAAKNLCNFASQGAKGTVIKDLERVITDFHSSKKPIGAVCIAPAIVGLALKGEACELSVGKKCSTSDAIEAMGHRHVQTEISECHIDRQHRIVTTPAYMDDKASLSDLFQGVRKLVGAVIELSVAE
jgi:enhancing lycopene biosynthesis protein 2